MERFLYILLLSCLIFYGCTYPEEKSPPPLIPMPSAPIDPTDAVLEKSMRQYLKTISAPQATRYNFIRYDLDSDGRRDALVMIKTPFGWWCNFNGCAMIIFKAHNDHFSVVNMVKPIRGPLTISPHKTNGWNNLVVRVSGRKERFKDVSLQYNGKHYPYNPALLPEYATLHIHEGLRVFD